MISGQQTEALRNRSELPASTGSAPKGGRAGGLDMGMVAWHEWVAKWKSGISRERTERKGTEGELQTNTKVPSLPLRKVPHSEK